MFSIEKIDKRLKKENEVRCGISLVNMDFIARIEYFNDLLKTLKKISFIKIPNDPHITILRCKSSKKPIYMTDKIKNTFEEIISQLNDIVLKFNNINIGNDGVIRALHSSNINNEWQGKCDGLDLKLINSPWVSLGRICEISDLENKFSLIKEIINNYKVPQYNYQLRNLQIVLFNDILFNDITILKDIQLTKGINQ